MTSIGKVHSAQTYLLEAHIVDVEVDISKGLHAFSVVGLPDKAVEEARDRVSAAIKHSGFASPKSRNQKIVVSLAPANLKKEGPLFDVPIALSYLLAKEEINFNPDKKLFVGELSLNGNVRGISGVLPLIEKAAKIGFTEAYVPEENAEEAALIKNIAVYPVKTLTELIEHLTNEKEKEILKKQPITKIKPDALQIENDFADVKGQETAKRGLLIAAAGGHNIAFYGPAGTGKTMLARALPGILPPLSYDEILEVTSIHSVARNLRGDYVSNPPFRSPHHTSSYVSLVGGGAFPKPGEVTLAHRGVLFLDEFPEFERRVIDALRQPLEDRKISISRQRGSGLFPADFILVAAMNPCPCGNYGSTKTCLCTPKDISRYRKKISGPIADRIDMWIEVPLVKHKVLGDRVEGRVKSSKDFRKEVVAAREHQHKRFADKKNKILNAGMSAKDIEKLVPLDKEAREILNNSSERLQLSARSYHKIIKLARTIADLAHERFVNKNHILEALQYRQREG